MATPVIQGTINRLRASVSIPGNSNLNVTPAYLGKDMISIIPQGDITHAIPTATGYVTSPEPYQIVEVHIHVLRTNGLGDLYKKQIEKLSTIGDFVVRSDTAPFSDYNISNGSIKSTNEIKYNGDDAGWLVVLQGAYQVNSALYNV